jgi:4-amino-4-deoxy-L-arabinose transferase-like glycosyltransferase
MRTWTGGRTVRGAWPPHGRLGGAVAACLLAGLVLFFNLGGYALWDPDEARHAEVAREMLRAADWRGWIVPSFDFHPYHDKPILFYWAVSAADALGGVNERAARAVPAIAALLTVLAVYLWGSRVWGPAAGFAAAVVLTTAAEFVALGRYANLDMLLTLWIAVGLLGVHRWTEKPDSRGWLALAAVAAALGALTKGLVAPVLIAGIGLAYLAATQRLGLLTFRRVVGAGVVFLAVAAPWYVTAGLVDPSYLGDFLLRHHVARFLEGARHFHPKPLYFPLLMLLAGFLPWSVFLPAALRNMLCQDRLEPSELFCVTWGLGVLLFFTLSRGNLGTYVLPATPPLALLTGRYVSRLQSCDRDLAPGERRLLVAGVVTLAVLCFAAVPALLAVASRLYAGVWRSTSLLSVMAVPFGVALLGLLGRRRCDLLPLVIGSGMLMIIAVFYGWAAPRISAVVSEAPLAQMIAVHASDGHPAPIVAYDVRTPSLLFYLHRAAYRTANPAQLARVLAGHPLVFVVSSPRHVPEMLATGRLYPWQTLGRHVLYASRPLTDDPGPSPRG